MNALEPFENFVVGRITFPGVNYVLNRRNILGHYQELLQSEWYPEDRLKELQHLKLARLVKTVCRWNPYYAKKFRDAGLVPEEIRSVEDIRRIPPLSREEVIEHHREMVDTRYQSSIPRAARSLEGPGTPVWWGRFRRHKLIRNTSTGSTGAPTIFYDDGSTTARNWAQELRLRDWYGIRPGVKEARLARVSAEYLPRSRVLWARKHLWHQLILPGMNLAEPEYALCLRRITEFRPRVLWGITTALTGLADYIRRTQADVSRWRLQLVITWAAPLYEHEKKLLGETFGCPVTNIYGSREVGHVAALCPQGSMHVNEEDYVVETEGTGGPGEILITTLNESPMPFIRYRIGDLGEVQRGKCPCSRSLQLMKNILGRIGQVYITSEGRMIAPNFWCRMFMLDRQSQTVERFQVVYRKNGSIRFLIVPKRNYSAETEADLRRFLVKNFTSAIQFEFVYVSEVKPHASGKYELVVRETP